MKTTRIKESDKFAYEYLAHQGFASIVYEPDGNVPPDFLVEGRIAIEARRLNQNEEGAVRGLEELSKPLNATVREAIASVGPPTAGASWFVQYIFRRPVLPRKELKRSLAVALRRLRDQSHHQPEKLRVAENFELELVRAARAHPTFFVLGASADNDGGGFVMLEMARNLRICLADKTKKVATVRSRYPEWWLVLEDRISYGDLNASERS